MTKPAHHKPLTSKQLAAQDPFADGPTPNQGGAWVRNEDGSLTRDGDTQQHIPKGEGPHAVLELDAPMIPPPPAGTTDTESQEG